MFELYDIFDNNEINIILLSIFVILLIIIIIGLAYYDYSMKQKLIKVETELKKVSDTLDLNLDNNNMFSDIPKNSNSNSSDENYKQKYEELVKGKDTKPNPMQYSPSEYATLLKYNPILPYSAFTMDIINNAYLDMNEKGLYEDKYFALSNYDNIYDSTRNNNNNNNKIIIIIIIIITNLLVKNKIQLIWQNYLNNNKEIIQILKLVIITQHYLNLIKTKMIFNKNNTIYIIMIYNYIFHIYNTFELYENNKKNIKCNKMFNEYKITLLKYYIKFPN